MDNSFFLENGLYEVTTSVLAQSEIVRLRLNKIDFVVFTLQVTGSLAVSKGKLEYQLSVSQ